MKYGKLIAKIFAQRTNNNAQVAVALVAGLAAGTILSILFAPEKGADTRRAISDRAMGLGNGIRNSCATLKNKITGNGSINAEPEISHLAHSMPQRRKVDLRNSTPEAHGEEHHTEQAIS